MTETKTKQSNPAMDAVQTKIQATGAKPSKQEITRSITTTLENAKKSLENELKVSASKTKTPTTFVSGTNQRKHTQEDITQPRENLKEAIKSSIEALEKQLDWEHYGMVRSFVAFGANGQSGGQLILRDGRYHGSDRNYKTVEAKSADRQKLEGRILALQQCYVETEKATDLNTLKNIQTKASGALSGQDFKLESQEKPQELKTLLGKNDYIATVTTVVGNHEGTENIEYTVTNNPSTKQNEATR